jgi:leucyl/phenylalanyl-tRNA--protein transferase
MKSPRQRLKTQSAFSKSDMPIFALTDELIFPPPELADENGIIAIGGDLRPERLLLAYQNGIFPWPHRDYPLMWFCPPQRFILEPNKVHLGRSLQKAMRKSPYEIRFDSHFTDVMRGCQSSFRPDQDGTWITDEIVKGYTGLHELGFAHSAEAYEDGELVGGVYGVSLGGIFCGESMFAKRPNASKVAFATLVAHLLEWDFKLIDCQNESEHLASFGAHTVSRKSFLGLLREALTPPTRRGKWACSMQPDDALRRIAVAQKSNSR